MGVSFQKVTNTLKPGKKFYVHIIMTSWKIGVLYSVYIVPTIEHDSRYNRILIKKNTYMT